MRNKKVSEDFQYNRDDIVEIDFKTSVLKRYIRSFFYLVYHQMTKLYAH